MVIRQGPSVVRSCCIQPSYAELRALTLRRARKLEPAHPASRANPGIVLPKEDEPVSAAPIRERGAAAFAIRR